MRLVGVEISNSSRLLGNLARSTETCCGFFFDKLFCHVMTSSFNHKTTSFEVKQVNISHCNFTCLKAINVFVSRHKFPFLHANTFKPMLLCSNKLCEVPFHEILFISSC